MQRYSNFSKVGSDQVYTFMAQDQKLGQIPQQTIECAQFIKNHLETKSFCEL